ncbi:recombinase family protein [Fodinicurvata sp. EGI_FJ10296]|uniref:recombinase family protein n=1 Tax=Fodinicurvata sp. EGI_FJ10296 TaxID=3231908 RepID=UPI00345206C6
MHTFSYTRVSTADQHTANQDQEIEAAGYAVDAAYAETISGKVPAMDRPEFVQLIDAISRTRKPKRLIVTKLDRLGRDAVDVQQTIKRLSEMDCSVKVLQLGDLDLTSSAGKLILATLSAVAEMERDLLVERTQSGLQRAKAQGKQLGRPRKIDPTDVPTIRERMGKGETISALAREFNASRATIMRLVR